MIFADRQRVDKRDIRRRKHCLEQRMHKTGELVISARKRSPDFEIPALSRRAPPAPSKIWFSLISTASLPFAGRAARSWCAKPALGSAPGWPRINDLASGKALAWPELH